MAIYNSTNNTVTVEKGDNLWRIAENYYGGGKNMQKLADLNGIPNASLIHPGQVIKLDGAAGSTGGSSSSGGSTSTSNEPKIHANGLQITYYGEIASNPGELFVVWKWAKLTDREVLTDHYVVEWTYKTTYGHNNWFVKTDSKSVNEDQYQESRQATFTVPDEATIVRFRIKTVAKEKESTDTSSTTKTYEYSSAWIDEYITIWEKDTAAIETPPNPETPEIDKQKMTVKVNGLDDINATHIVFEVYKDDASKVYLTSPEIEITVTKMASWQCTVDLGSEYKVRCKAVRGTKSSEWSSFTDGVSSMPAAPEGITKIEAKSKTSIYLEWTSVTNAKTYELEYTTNKDYFDISDKTTQTTGITEPRYLLTDLESGEEYFFRVRSVNKDNVQSEWSEIVSLAIGKKPSPPTTWSSTTTVITGEKLTLYWVHNSNDNSSQVAAEVEFTINDTVIEPSFSVNNTTDEDEKDKTSKCVVDTKDGTITFFEYDSEAKEYREKIFYLGYSFVEGVKLEWRVKTRGVTADYSDWSIQRRVDVYAPPELDFRILGSKTVEDEDSNISKVPGDRISELNNFPFYIYGVGGPKTQTPIGYYVTVKSDQAYTTVDQIGNERIVGVNEEVYSKYFDVTGSILVEFTPGNIDLESGMSYTVSCIVSMDSGLKAEESQTLKVSWSEQSYSPDAVIVYDTNNYITHIQPHCYEYSESYHKVVLDNGVYKTNDDVVDISKVNNVYTDTGETVYVYKDSKGSLAYYCYVYNDNKGNPIDKTSYIVRKTNDSYYKTSTKVAKSSIKMLKTDKGVEVKLGTTDSGSSFLYASVTERRLVDDITLAVYRREFDGSFVEVASGLKNSEQTSVTDPHPALDYARYRVVATADATGSVSYYDVPGFPINETGAIIQWDEQWSTFDADPDSSLANPPWTGSLIRLPYNFDITENVNQEVTLVNYIGRKRPVSYYGTRIGETQSWSVVIPKDDKETVYNLRRLQNWMGDVYVREPSGTGYWANIKVSFSQTHKEVTIPVSIEITRVEGGL